MEMTDILALARAGFNATQIAALAKITPAAPPVQAAPPAAPAQNPATQLPGAQVPPAALFNQTPAQLPGAPAAQTATDPIMAQMQALTAAIQANGILNSAQPKQETADDVLASIINPPAPEKK